MKHIIYCFILLSCWALLACSPAVTTTQNGQSTTKTKEQSSKSEKFVQDLSSYRPVFPNQPSTNMANTNKGTGVTIDKKEQNRSVNKRLDPILDTLAARNKGIKYANGFRIQIYVGNDKRAADEAKIFTYQTFPEIFPYLVYQQPVYKVKVGDFLNRMDAERYCATIRENYPSAMILPDKVEIKKSMLVK